MILLHLNITRAPYKLPFRPQQTQHLINNFLKWKYHFGRRYVTMTMCTHVYIGEFICLINLIKQFSGSTNGRVDRLSVQPFNNIQFVFSHAWRSHTNTRTHTPPGRVNQLCFAYRFDCESAPLGVWKKEGAGMGTRDREREREPSDRLGGGIGGEC